MSMIKRAKSSIFGLETDLTNLGTSISTEATARETADGDLSTLSTTAKGNLVAAINELYLGLGTTGGASLQKSQNLGDLTDVPAARTNLDVYSTTEVDTAINTAQLAMGTNYDVADIAARDALVDLDVADRVFVGDDGDGKWALYKVGAVDGTGAGTAWMKIMDQDGLENSISAASIKAAYESNTDTNAYTDSEKAKVALVTVSQAIDLDDAVLKANLEQDLAASASATEGVSAAAAKAYVDANIASSGLESILEDLTVTAGAIDLTKTPVNGLPSIGNFARCEYTDANGVTYSATLAVGSGAKNFTVETDVAGQWDGFAVRIQYTALAAE